MLYQSRRVVVGALLGLVVFAGSAAAECAWVLWAAPPDATSSSPVAAYETRQPCERRADENRVGGTVWVCLPDTVDPRVPKGKLTP